MTIYPGMRVTAAAAILLAVSCYSVDTTKPPETLKHRVLAEGGYGRVQGGQRQVAYAATERAYNNLWNSLIGQGDPPLIDFSKEGVLFLAAGERPTGGYGLSVTTIRREGDAIVVNAAVTPPPPDAMVTQAITSPFLVVAVPKIDGADVRWEKE